MNIKDEWLFFFGGGGGFVIGQNGKNNLSVNCFLKGSIKNRIYL